MSLPSSILHDIANSFVSAFTDLDVDTHSALRAPECTHIFAPSSLRMPSKSNAEFAAHLTDNLLPLLAHFPVTVKETHINETARQVTIWATGKPEFRVEAMRDTPKEDWDFVNEYIFILDVNQAGKITRVVEFLDSSTTERLRDAIGKARINIGKKGQAW